MAKVAREQQLLTKAGDLLGEHEIEALADEAQAGYDLSHSRWLKVGRPALGELAGESPRIGFRASKDLQNAAQSRARAEGISVSALAREAMERYLQGADLQPARRRRRTKATAGRSTLRRSSSNSS